MKKRGRTPPRLLKVLDQCFPFEETLLDQSTSEVLRAAGPSSRHSNPFCANTNPAWAQVQLRVDQFAQRFPEEAVDTLRVYEKYTYSQVFDTKTINHTDDDDYDDAQYSASLQAACAAFGSIMKDAHFLNLALVEMDYAWSELGPESGVLSIRDYQSLFRIRPLADNILRSIALAQETASLEDEEAAIASVDDYLTSLTEVHPKSWKSLGLKGGRCTFL
jgi:hypothetical protein